jgi:hypothetical protein
MAYLTNRLALLMGARNYQMVRGVKGVIDSAQTPFRSQDSAQLVPARRQ